MLLCLRKTYPIKDCKNDLLFLSAQKHKNVILSNFPVHCGKTFVLSPFTLDSKILNHFNLICFKSTFIFYFF